MKVYTDSIEYIERLMGEMKGGWQADAEPPGEKGLRQLLQSLYANKEVLRSNDTGDPSWSYLFAVENVSASQYDLLIEITQKHVEMPDAVLCAAGAGKKFHGFKQRPWESFMGNIHLSVFLAPNKPISHLSAAFMVLPAVSVVQAIDRIPGLEKRASIKWVNDILIDGAKVCGVLAHSQVIKKTVTGAVLGIGLNVEVSPQVPASPFTPRAASLSEFARDTGVCNQRAVFEHLIRCLWENYTTLMSGEYNRLLDVYRERSGVIGKDVTVCYDDDCTESVSGRVSGIGENLELKLGGIQEPVLRGRLILKE